MFSHTKRYRGVDKRQVLGFSSFFDDEPFELAKACVQLLAVARKVVCNAIHWQICNCRGVKTCWAILDGGILLPL
jgi:hypothetical protein